MYTLVHLTGGGEFKTPLVASQLFDQAEFQAGVKDYFDPYAVAVWCIEPMRELFDSATKLHVSELKKRCPTISIRMIGGIGRLKKFPTLPHLIYHRLKLKGKVIYHCRGERVMSWALALKKMFPQDKIVLDVRGFWPAELLYARGIDDPKKATGKNLLDYQIASSFLKKSIQSADGVTTVSHELKKLLIEEYGAGEYTYVVPCCVSKISDDSCRREVRRKWGASDANIVVLYSGTTAKYQHLEDMAFPFLKNLLKHNKLIKVVVLTPEVEMMRKITDACGFESSDVLIYQVPQAEVLTELTGADVGIVIRKPTLVNAVANPVKIGEYLSSGLSIMIEHGIGGISDLSDCPVIKWLHISDPTYDQSSQLAEINKWINEYSTEKRKLSREIAERKFLWKSSIKVHRKMYERLLNFSE